MLSKGDLGAILIHLIYPVCVSVPLVGNVGTGNQWIQFRLPLNILAPGNHDSGIKETNVPEAETTFDWLDDC